ncbi:MAG: tetratricopeptide repeat protein [Saprospiraceae bacterium]
MFVNAKVRVLFSLLVFAFMACSVKKSRKDVTKTEMFFHNLTAKYNGYFNAKELLDVSEQALNDQYKDDYNKILELYPYNGIENPTVAAANLDIAIKKASTVINIHRPSHWVEDSYLLIGQAQYLKQDYVTAEETFKFITKNYFKLHDNPKTDGKLQKAREKAVKVKEQMDKKEADLKAREKAKKTTDKVRKAKTKTRQEEAKDKAKAREQLIKDRKKGIKTPKPVGGSTEKTKTPTVKPTRDSISGKTTLKKEEEEKAVVQKDKPIKPEGGHRPVLQDAQMWLAKTYTMRKNGIAAGIILGTLRHDPGLYDELKPEVTILQAYNHIRQEEYNEAIPYLEEALISKDVPTNRKARIAFVLGQLQDKLNQDAAAYDAFNKVLDYHPDYDMEFFAKLMSAQKAIAAGKRDKDQLLAELKKMTRDDKNIDYRTAIYHAMAMVSLEGGQRDQAKEYLITGLGAGVNPIQKTESFYKLASLYYEDEDYLKAKKYYDSSFFIMSEKDLRKKEAERYSVSLADIAKNITIIEIQDSMLRVSQLNDKEQKQWAKKIIKEREKLVSAKVGTPAPNILDPSPFSKSNINLSTVGSSDTRTTFFAYDEKVLKKGLRDFEKTWGNIKLQDNWQVSQRSNNNISNDVADKTNDPNKPDPNFQEESTDDIASILKDIPNTPESKTAANDKIRNSMYQLGILYREKLENYTRSIKILEELLKKYPGSGIEQDVLYQLYLACSQNNDVAKANFYKEKLLAEFPGSKYAQSLKDPNWDTNNQDKSSKLVAYYDETYHLFSADQCDVALNRVHLVDSLFKENPIRIKFAMVEAMCIGRLQGKEAYVNALKDFIARYPQSEERDKAKDMLRYLMGDEKAFEVSDIQKTSVDPNAFEYIEDELHYVIAIVFDKNASTLSDIKVSVSDFNQRYFQNDDLRISNIFLDQDATIPIIMIRKFDSAAKAMVYFHAISNNPKQFIVPEINHEVYAISQSNYRKLYSTKDTESYKEFFKTKYK